MHCRTCTLEQWKLFDFKKWRKGNLVKCLMRNNLKKWPSNLNFVRKVEKCIKDERLPSQWTRLNCYQRILWRRKWLYLISALKNNMKGPCLLIWSNFIKKRKRSLVKLNIWNERRKKKIWRNAFLDLWSTRNLKF